MSPLWLRVEIWWPWLCMQLLRLSTHVENDGMGYSWAREESEQQGSEPAWTNSQQPSTTTNHLLHCCATTAQPMRRLWCQPTRWNSILPQMRRPTDHNSTTHHRWEGTTDTYRSRPTGAQLHHRSQRHDFSITGSPRSLNVLEWFAVINRTIENFWPSYLSVKNWGLSILEELE